MIPFEIMNYVKEINENVLNLIANRQQQKAAIEGQLRCKLNSNGQKKARSGRGVSNICG